MSLLMSTKFAQVFRRVSQACAPVPEADMDHHVEVGGAHRHVHHLHCQHHPAAD